MDIKKVKIRSNMKQKKLTTNSQVPATAPKEILNNKENSTPESGALELSESDLIEVVEPIVTKKHYSRLGYDELLKKNSTPESGTSDLPGSDLIEVVEPIVTKKHYSLLGTKKLPKNITENLPKGASGGYNAKKQ